MSTIDLPVVAGRLTSDRLSSYLSAAHGDLRGAMALYDWNTAVGGALHEDIGRFDVVFRNTIDQALVTHGRTHDWETAWYSRMSLFTGKRSRRVLMTYARPGSGSTGATPPRPTEGSSRS